MRVGEIYFICERDRRDGESTSYVKIGMVSDTERGSLERLNEHQTGNPRDLVLHHATQTPNPFRVERFLHQQFGTKRVRSEWFSLDEAELQAAVSMSERLAQEAFAHLPTIERAKELASVVSSPQHIPATPDATDWHVKLMTAKAAVKFCNSLKAEYRSVTTTLSENERNEAELEELIVTEQYVVTSFDEDGFAAKYPELFQQFLATTTSVSGRFTPAKLAIELSETHRDLSDFGKEFATACDRVKRNEMKFSELFSLHQELEYFEGACQWDEEIADAHLRVICGEASGVEGLCMWNRTETTSATLDKDGLDAAHPTEFAEFTTAEVRTRTKTKKRARRHK